jgi:hypothetical protein
VTLVPKDVTHYTRLHTPATPVPTLPYGRTTKLLLRLRQLGVDQLMRFLHCRVWYRRRGSPQIAQICARPNWLPICLVVFFVAFAHVRCPENGESRSRRFYNSVGCRARVSDIQNVGATELTTCSRVKRAALRTKRTLGKAYQWFAMHQPLLARSPYALADVRLCKPLTGDQAPDVILRTKSRVSSPHIVPHRPIKLRESWSEWQDLNLRPLVPNTGAVGQGANLLTFLRAFARVESHASDTRRLFMLIWALDDPVIDRGVFERPFALPNETVSLQIVRREEAGDRARRRSRTLGRRCLCLSAKGTTGSSVWLMFTAQSSDSAAN